MLSAEFTMDKIWAKKLLEGVDEIGEVLAGMFLYEFRDLVYRAPQRSGEYVANFRITVNGGAAGYTEMPYRRREDWYAAGSRPAIDKAMASVGGVKEAAGMGARGGRPVLLALENDVEYTDAAANASRTVMGYPGDPGNPESPGHIDDFRANMAAHTQKRIYVGKATWEFYKGFDI
jgi:hypothetical protein